MIKDNLEEVRSRVKLATLRAGRKEEDVTLIAVSKTKPVEMLKEVYDLGVRDFGENKVQELVSKYEELPADIRWHMIGHLQTNKVKYIVDKAYMIHSVDSYKLAKEISKEAVKINKVVKILIEVNVAAEESKFGSNVEETLSLVEDISRLPGICIKGLMTVAEGMMLGIHEGAALTGGVTNNGIIQGNFSDVDLQNNGIWYPVFESDVKQKAKESVITKEDVVAEIYAANE